MSMTKNVYTARCYRSGKWWAIEVPEVPGAHSQARRLDQVEANAREAIGLILDVDGDTFDITVQVDLDDVVRGQVEALAQARERATEAQKNAAATAAGVAADLVARGLSTRDAGTVMGLSHQRVAQLLQEVSLAGGG